MSVLTCYHYFFYSRNNTPPILITLPNIVSDVGMITPEKQQKPVYKVIYIHSSRSSKPAAARHSHSLNNAMPVLINFNAMNILHLSHPGTRNGIPAGSKVSVLNKSNSSINVADASVCRSILHSFLSPVDNSTFYSLEHLKSKLKKIEEKSIEELRIEEKVKIVKNK